MVCLVADRALLAERGVAAAGVVERFDVVEDGAGEVAAVGPAASVEQLELEGAEEALGQRNGFCSQS